MKLLAAVRFEGLDGSLRRSVGRGEQLPVLLAGGKGQWRVVLLELELEALAEQVAHVIPVAPGERTACARRRWRKVGPHHLEDVVHARLGLPACEREPSSGFGDARELARDRLVIGSEHHPACREHDVETRVVVRHLLESPTSKSTSTPSSAARTRAVSMSTGAMSWPTTSAPRFAARMATAPVPVAASRTRSPGFGSTRSMTRSWMSRIVFVMRS